MKRILVFLVCALLICAMPIVVFAEEGESAPVEPSISESENLPAESENVSVPEPPPTESETVPEGNNSEAESVPEETYTEQIVDYLKSNLEEILVMVTMLFTAFLGTIVRRNLGNTIGTLNNNAITVAEKSKDAIDLALSKVDDLATTVLKYEEKMVSLIEEIRISEEEKKAFAEALVRVEAYINTAKLANVELANELAELLCLANIPNSKKEELYARHMKSIRLLEAAEEEVKANDGKET